MRKAKKAKAKAPAKVKPSYRFEIAFAVLMVLLIGAFVVAMLAGCQLPEGTNMENSTVGFDFAPLGKGPNSPRLLLGSSTQHFSTPPPPDAGPVLNRSQVRAPFIDQTSTIAAGPVGEQLGQAGDVLTDAVKSLHPAKEPDPPELPVELPSPSPRSDPGKP